MKLAFILIVLLLMILIFFIGVIIILAVKNSHNKESNSSSLQNNYDGDYTQNSSEEMIYTSSEVNNNIEQPSDMNYQNRQNKSKKGSCLLIGCGTIIAIVFLVLGLFASLYAFSHRARTKLDDFGHDIKNTKIELSDLSFSSANYKEEDYEKLFNNMIKDMDLKGEVLFNRIYLSFDEDGKIKYMSVDFVNINGDRYKNQSVNYGYNNGKRCFSYDKDDSHSYHFDKSQRKRYMTVKEGCELFKKYLAVIDDSADDTTISFSTGKYTSVDDFYHEDTDTTSYKYYLTDLDNAKVKEMPKNYGENSYGIYSVMTVEKYKEDKSYQEKYIYEWK